MVRHVAIWSVIMSLLACFPAGVRPGLAGPGQQNKAGKKQGWESVWDSPGFEASIRSLIGAVDAERMSKHLFYLAKDPLPYRKLNFTLPGHEKNTLYEADDYLAGKLESWGYRVEREGVRVQAFRRDTSKPKHAPVLAAHARRPLVHGLQSLRREEGPLASRRDHRRAGPQGLAELDRFARGQRQRDRNRRRPGDGLRARQAYAPSAPSGFSSATKSTRPGPA